ncbi:MAG: hypothetical protein LBD48_14200, partial [Treponema sp.]|nr:hypothetical protein [Treponema sp.]
MKNKEKSPKKPGAVRKSVGTAKVSGKKPGSALEKRSAPKKRKKRIPSDAWRAVFLAALLIAVSAFVSMAVIIVHSTLSKPPAAAVVSAPGAVPPLPAERNTSAPEPTSSVPAKPAERPAPVPAKPMPAASSSRPAESPAPVPAPAPAKSAPPPTASPSRPIERPAPVNAAPSSVPAAKPVPAAKSAPAAQPPERPVERRGTLVFVIDDAGNNLRELEPFLRFPGPLT